VALSANTVFEVRLAGNDTNGGGFVTGASGTDWSQQTSPQYSVTDGVTAGTTTITSASAAFGTDVIGNIISVSGGTGAVAQGWYQITARPSATQITVDRATGLTAGTGVTLKIGGALFSPGGSAAAQVSGGNVTNVTTFIQYDPSPYVITSTSNNVSGGCVSPSSGTWWIGYDSSRTRYAWPLQANRPTIQFNAGVTNVVIFTNVNTFYFLQSVILDCNNQTTSRASVMSGEFWYVKAMNGTWNTTGGVLMNNSNGRAILCEITGNTVTGASACLSTNQNYFCSVHDNTVAAGQNAIAYNTGAAGLGYGTICYNTTGGSGFGLGATHANCVSYNNAQAGFLPQNSSCAYFNCIAENNGTFGWTGGTGQTVLLNCSSYNNTSGRSTPATGRISDVNPLTPTGTVFTAPGSADFSLNNTVGTGAALRAAGFPTVFWGVNNYADVGAYQHQDTGGGGSTGISRARGASGF